MVAKKSFQDGKAAAEMFVTVPDKNNAEETREDEAKPDKKPIENQFKSKEKEDVAGRQGTLFDVPKKLKEAKKKGSGFETKSKKFQLLIQPSVYEKIKELAELREPPSVNDFIHTLLEKAIKEEG